MFLESPRRVAVLGASRIPFARSHTLYSGVSNSHMLTAALAGVVNRFDLKGVELGEVAAGAVLKHSKDWNMARECTIGCGLSATTPAFDIQRACGTSLDAAILLANKIALGQIDSAIAAGVDTVSDVPIVYPDGYRQILLKAFRARSAKDKALPFLGLRPRHFKPLLPGVNEPRTGLSMGESTEIVAKQWQIGRAEQDELALASHHNCARAYREGFFDDLIISFRGHTRDNNLRPETSIEKLAKLRTVFDESARGTMTAGNSTPLTDGASAALLANEDWARERDLEPLAYITHVKSAAVDFVNGEGLLMAPTIAVSRMLQDAGLGLQDFDFYEIHEAFAAQVLATLKAWESPEYCRDRLGRSEPLGSIDRSKLNVKGSSLAVGHPFAATGTRILGVAAKLLAEKGSGRALISLCTAGGMGVTAILER